MAGEAVILSTIEGLSTIRAIHGGAGDTLFKQLAQGAMMFTDWEQFAFATLSPGGGAGEHVHTRTEEVFYILSGKAVVQVDGEEIAVGAGDLILTGYGAHQSIFNTGEEPLTMLIIEAIPPEIVQRLPEHSPLVGGQS